MALKVILKNGNTVYPPRNIGMKDFERAINRMVEKKELNTTQYHFCFANIDGETQFIIDLCQVSAVLFDTPYSE
jgi:hypothetical protein